MGHGAGLDESPHCPGEPEPGVRLLTGWLQGGAGAVALLIGQEATGLCEVTGLPGRRAGLWWRCSQLPLCWSWQRPQPPEITARVSKCRDTSAGGCFLQSHSDRLCPGWREGHAGPSAAPGAHSSCGPGPDSDPGAGRRGLVPDTPCAPSPCSRPAASQTSGPKSQGPCPPADGAADSGGPGTAPCSSRPSVCLRLPHIHRPGAMASACNCHGPRTRPAGSGWWHPAPPV